MKSVTYLLDEYTALQRLLFSSKLSPILDMTSAIFPRHGLRNNCMHDIAGLNALCFLVPRCCGAC